MKRTAGRPKGKNNRVAMTLRFRKEFAALIKKISIKENFSQARVIEIALSKYAKEICS